MPCMAWVMPSIMSFELFIVPATMPYTTPGTRNRKKISETIARIIGELNEVSSPSGVRHADPSGRAVTNRTMRPKTIEMSAQRRPLRSFGCRSCISGRSSSSPSISMPLSRGSTTRSVSHHPRPMISTDDAVVKK